MSIIMTDVSGVTKKVEVIDVSDDNATPSKAQTEAAADDIIKEAGKRDTKEDNAPVEAREVKQPEPPADDGDKASPDEVADAIVDAATGDEVVEDSRSNTIIGDAKNKAASIEEQMDKAEDKTDIKIMDTNVQSSSALEAAGEVNSDVKRKVFERLGDQDPNKPDFTMEHEVGDAQDMNKTTVHNVPKNIVIL
jgi:hypothetical protein